MTPDDRIWQSLEHCIDVNAITIDRPKNSRHPRFPDTVYPLEYGFVNGTTAGDGEGIDVFVGSDPQLGLTALAVSAHRPPCPGGRVALSRSTWAVRASILRSMRSMCSTVA